ncbi:MAG: DHH family phosphoesterase [Thermoplasmata archaeon]|nr:DHH family phosphoesterase [Thermoplasmata archaeon]
MPSGPERFVSDPSYTTEFAKARELLLGHPGRWRIIYHYDGDGIASASCLVRALLRLGYKVQATPLVGVERSRMVELLSTHRGPTLVVDTGASWLDLYPPHPAPVIVLDHHKYPGAPTPPSLPAHVALVNPLDWGVDGMVDLCAATLSWLYTIFLDPRNWDNAPWGLSGAISDRQHQEGFKGLNATLVKEAVERSLLVAAPGPPLFGRNLGEAVTQSVDPYLRGLSGRPDATRGFLSMMGLDAARPLKDLTSGDIQRLTAALHARLTAQGTRPEFCDILTHTSYTAPSLGVSTLELSTLQNATGRIGEPGVGIALALGDRRASARAHEAEDQWRTGVMAGLRRIEDGGVQSLSAIQWFDSPDTTLAGTQAGLAMNYLLDPLRPVFAGSHLEHATKVSGRGTLHLVGQGLDLAIACRSAAERVGGEGGGHRVAAGATLPAGKWDDFLAEANRLISAQLPGSEAPGA